MREPSESKDGKQIGQPSRTQSNPLREQLQKLHNRMSELKDGIFFDQWNVVHYPQFVTEAKRLNFSIPIPSEARLVDRAWDQEGELKKLTIQFQTLERQMLEGR